MLIRKSFLLAIILLFTNTDCLKSSKDDLHQKKHPPCKACKVLVDSFKKGAERTSKGKFEGGDTAWEEKNLGSYLTSEIRLTEIQEKICSDVEVGKDQCYTINEESDSEIETWWFKKQKEHPDLYQYLCIDTLKLCCPENHFGNDCIPCEGYPDNICNNNGKCKGAGTRKGSGKCTCDEGYSGESCNECSKGYFEAYKDEKKLLCSKCHAACEGPCGKGGTAGCVRCKSGWTMDEEIGCMDVNECALVKHPCNLNEFCVNNEGSYRCLQCDKSCSGCTGDGPDMCTICASGYLLLENMCVDSEHESRKQHVFLTRYLTYFGLCVATCIILHKNTALAALIGLVVAVYISVSEYILNSPPTPKLDQGFGQKILEAAS